jgi:ligand-binding sensor domain-containing protein/signal transduction histidine kinase
MRRSLPILAILLHSTAADALNSSLEISSYGHTAWTVRNAVLKGAPRALTQTTDGYLWLATELGLLRFDGVRFVHWSPPAATPLASDDVVSVFGARDGSLWIGTDRGLARWKNATLTQYSELAEYYITAISEDLEGTVWVGTTARVTGHARLCAIGSRGVECTGDDGTLGRFVLSLHVDRRGVVWVGAASGLWRWRPGRPTAYALPSPRSEPHAIAEHTDGTLLLALNREIRRFVDGRLERYELPIGDVGLKPTSLRVDRDGGLWIGTQDRGLFHVSQGRVDQFARNDGLSGDFVSDIFEDHEGNVWVATWDGLDRFHNLPIPTISAKHGLSASTVVSVLADPDGTVWLGTLNGLDRWRNGEVVAYASQPGASHEVVASLLRDHEGRLWVSSPQGLTYLQDGRFHRVKDVPGGYVHAMVEDRGRSIWVSDQDRGLFQLRERHLVRRVPWTALGGKVARALTPDLERGGLWLGFFQGGVAYFDGERIGSAFGTSEGLGDGGVTHLYLDRNGSLWIATRGGLSRLQHDKVRTLTQEHGLPCSAVHWVMEDRRQAFWLYTACGLVRIPREELEAWSRGAAARVSPTIYSERDGVSSRSQPGSYGPKVVRTADGRLLFATHEGVSVIDPEQIPRNDVAPPVHVEQIVADGKTYSPSSDPQLPALVRNLRIDYTALSLTVPEKVRFRYMLEGRDQDWVEVVNRREVFYTDLPPRPYRFRVMASNNDGVWNTEGAVVSFSIQPSFYQTRTFLAGLTAAILAALWALYRARLRRIATQLNVRFEERLTERARIAQDLHDTLLGGVISTAMQLDTITESVEDESLKSRLDGVLGRMRHVIDEGRDALQGIRSKPALDDLEQALGRCTEELRGHQPVDIRVIVVGSRRLLHPLTRDEIYRIGREALANTFRHARATRVEVELDYGEHCFRLKVRDDGQGFESDVASSERSRHWGISGMRERAERLGGRLELWTRPNAGTEVNLVVPGHVAFQRYERGRRRWRRQTELIDINRPQDQG